ncbi:MAG: HAD family phosphatase [Beijerinckiaceae bacterium]|jgi:2-haloacid dehalogenase|nr:HAD family phosphatase [Beijerinckiaceae bacterium]
MPGTLVFDIGQVLLRYDPHLAFLDLLPEREARLHFLTHILPPEWNLEQDRGRDWREAEAMQIALHPDHADLIRAFRANWHKMVPEAIAPNVAVLEDALAAGIPTYAITNFAADTFMEACGMYPFLTRFHGRVVSAEEKLIKPDPAIYRVFLERFGKRAEDCLFMDDSRANVESAKALGFSVIHVTPETDLRAEVRGYGFAI